MSEPKQGVVELVDAGVPADQGLSSLGLLMQLAGNLFAAIAALIAFLSLFWLRGSGETLSVLLLFSSAVARSLFLRNAGSQLLYGNAGDEGRQRTAGIRRYLVFAALQTLLVGAILGGKLHAEGTLVLAAVSGLAVWPVTLGALMALPRFRRFQNELPLPEDKGFESASILMTVLGLCGLLATGTVLIALLDMPGRALTRGPGVLVALGLVMLVARSVLHIQAGLSGLRETNVDHAVELANRYANFGVISAFCGGGAMLMFVVSVGLDVMGLALIAGLCWLLMAWPLTIRQFYGDRQFADLLAGDQAPIHRRAPDAGLTGLGWLLICHAALTASFLLPQLIGDSANMTRQQEMLLALGGSVGVHSLWFNVGVLVLQGWAGFELVRMSPHSRVIAIAYGIVATVTNLYIMWPVLQVLKHARGLDYDAALRIGPMALHLVLPVATFVLVTRKIAPTARARFRSARPTT